MTSTQALHAAEECRAIAGLLIAFAICTALASAGVCYSLGPGFIFLACIAAALVFLTGYFRETAEARRFDRIARQRLPLHYENHGHE